MPSFCDAGDLGLWPMPKSCDIQREISWTIQRGIPIQVRESSSSEVLRLGIDRFREQSFVPFEYKVRGPLAPHLSTGVSETEAQDPGSTLPSTGCVINRIVIVVDDTLPTTKSLASDESYELKLGDPGSGCSTEATITAAQPWGALYALDTFSQLLFHNRSAGQWQVLGPINIKDAPRFPYRGLMLDTANHHISVPALKRTVSAMAANRMNVLHWHIVDSYSFPLESDAFPLLSTHGAWDERSATYSTAEVRELVEYARVRGVRIVPELDVPSHAYSWGLAYPNLTTSCPADVLRNFTDIGLVNSIPLDPTVDFTYTVVKGLIEEFASLFPDEFLHVGGDELILECWRKDEGVQERLAEMKGVESVEDLRALFETRLMAMLAACGRRPLIWNEMFDEEAATISQNAIVEVWSSEAESSLRNAIASGFDVIVADGWYLDRQTPVGVPPPDGPTGWFWQDTCWQMYVHPHDRLCPCAFPWELIVSALKNRYEVEPGRLLDNDADEIEGRGSILGGEACMWTENVASEMLDAQVWPRTCAVAERLWSPARVNVSGNAAQRLGKHRCRMLAREVVDSMPPIWSDYCSYDHALKESDNGADGNVSRNDHALSSGAIAACVLAAMLFFAGLVLAVSSATRAVRARTHRPGIRGSGDDLRLPLLPAQSNDADPLSKPKEPVLKKKNKARLRSLDVFRGLAIALMILVDEAGESWPEIDHAPWDGIALADIVMPFFDFAVGISIALALIKNFGLHIPATPAARAGINARRWTALRKASVRFVKLFLLGLLTQGGTEFMNYDLRYLRLMGILQRVAVCYYVVAVLAIFLPPLQRGVSTLEMSADGGAGGDEEAEVGIFELYWQHRYMWAFGGGLLLVHTSILYGINVPPQAGEVCGRGVLDPPCNAAAWVDAKILGKTHMFFPFLRWGCDATFQRLPECSSCSPGKCPINDPSTISPEWCATKRCEDGAPFEPEGLVSQLNAIITTLLGVHIGLIMLRVKLLRIKLVHFAVNISWQLSLGLALHFSSIMPLNTNARGLYSFSFVLVTGAAATFAFGTLHVIVDTKNFRDRLAGADRVAQCLWLPLSWLGMNAIVLYLCAEGGVIPWLLSRFYVDGNPEYNLANVLYPTGVLWGDIAESNGGWPEEPYHNIAVLLWTLAYIGFWMFVAFVLHANRIYIVI